MGKRSRHVSGKISVSIGHHNLERCAKTRVPSAAQDKKAVHLGAHGFSQLQPGAGGGSGVCCGGGGGQFDKLCVGV